MMAYGGCRRRALNEGKLLLMIFLLSFFCVLGTHVLADRGKENNESRQKISDRGFRARFYSREMWEDADSLPEQCRKYLRQVKREAKYFPVPESTTAPDLTVSYVDGWMAERTYGGERGHEGTDLMASENRRGLYPVVSISDGVISNLGWLERGGYRIGITSDSGTYYYYAHMESYAGIREGDRVKAGQFLGYMGDSGYGEEGTVGMFDVHLHVGIYFYDSGEEISVNPYYLLKSLEKHRLKYEYS